MATRTEAARPPTDDKTWPAPPGEPVIFVSEVATPTERELIDRWIADHRPPETRPEQIRTEHFDRPRSEQELVRYEERVVDLLGSGDDPWFATLRVAWLPRVHAGGTVRLRDVLVVGDPRRPRPWAQRYLARQPQRSTVINGGAARESWLRRRWRRRTGGGDDGESFPHFLLLQGVLSMERAEAARLGAQYRVPRLAREDLSSSTRFQSGLADVAAELHRPRDDVSAEASRYLAEMVTGYGSLLIDLTARFGRFVYRQGYDPVVDYDQAQVDRVRRALGDHPAVVLPTHKSMLDPMVMPAAFRELGFPRNHTLGGINLAFWPIGPLMRRSGVIFIRRRIADNPVYRFVLREYIGYLVEKRFNLEWYIEGGRTRTGKLLPPRLGLLAYVADAYWQGRADDVVLLPVSIAYDQLHEVREFAHEARGGSKRPENLKWLINYLRAQRSNFGRIYVRFGEPVSMRASLGSPPPVTGGTGRPDQLALQKMAFAVAVRINRVTPITATALVAFALLGANGRALTLRQVRAALEEPLEFVQQRHLPLAESARRLTEARGVSAALDELRRHGVVTVYDQGPDPVFLVEGNGYHAAAFYRNSIVHFFLLSAIGELALLHAAEAVEEPVEVFWYEAARLRDLLKFDFFFFERHEFTERLAAEMARHDPAWEEQVAGGQHAARGLLGTFRPLCSHLTLRSFFEAYLVVADVLVAWGEDKARTGAETTGTQATVGEPSEKALLAACQARGQQYLLQKRIHSPEAVSALLFKTGLQLAGNRGLLAPAGGRPGQNGARSPAGARVGRATA